MGKQAREKQIIEKREKSNDHSEYCLINRSTQPGPCRVWNGNVENYSKTSSEMLNTQSGALKMWRILLDNELSASWENHNWLKPQTEIARAI